MTDVGALDLSTDVLVIGGGLAGTWAAVAAAREGVRVILADKGYCGTSGVTATAGPGHWWVPPDPPELRDAAIRDRQSRAFGLAESGWMAAIIDLTWRTLPTLAPYYDFGTDDRGQVQYRGLRGPEYMRAMRRLAQDQGVTILDHCPALELLVDRQGAVVGAAGTRRQARQPWTIRAGAVVLATGGCAFRSRLLGADTNTGDGLLMAAEAGADLSGMELSNYYTIAPARSNMTRSMAYSFGRYFDADGRELDVPQGAAPVLARALLKGPVFCRLDRVPGDIRTVMPQVQPNFMLPFDRRGVDPYSQAFEVTLHGEGTVRGVGGLRVVDGDCRTAVRGLFVAGDAASRELIAGATSGGGAQNSAWALSSGHWAGQGAARLARGPGLRHSPIALHAGRAGMRPARADKAVDPRAAIAAVRGEMEPYDKNMFRTGAGLARSLDAVETVWRELADHGRGEADQVLAHREAAAIAATARWCLSAALARNESRGMHQRLDAPDLDPTLASRLRVGGLDRVWTAFERAPAARAIA